MFRRKGFRTFPSFLLHFPAHAFYGVHGTLWENIHSLEKSIYSCFGKIHANALLWWVVHCCFFFLLRSSKVSPLDDIAFLIHFNLDRCRRKLKPINCWWTLSTSWLYKTRQCEKTGRILVRVIEKLDSSE